jgi:Tfp pilus assembly protein PilN
MSKEKPEEVCQQLAEQINAIVQFYDVEVADSAKKWEVTVVADSVVLTEDTEESLRAKVADVTLEVKAIEDAWQYTPIAESHLGPERPSAVAIGLAMRLLDIDASNLRINMMLSESSEVKSVKKQLLITANIVAAIFLAMILSSGGLSLWAEKVIHRTGHKKQTELPESLHTLIKEKQRLDKQIKDLSDRPDHLSKMLGSRKAVDWAEILNDIGTRTPKTVRITKLSNKERDSKIYLEGLALSYKAVDIFVEMLNQSQFLNSASIIEAERDQDLEGLVRYSIDCLITEIENN